MAAKNQIGQDPGSGLLTFVLQTPPPGNWRAEESHRLQPSLRMRTSRTRPEVEGSWRGHGCCRSPRLSASFRTLWRGRNWTDCVLLWTCEIRQHKEPKMKQLLSKRQLRVDDLPGPSICEPPSRDSQRAAASTQESMFWLVGWGGAGRSTLDKSMREMFLQRVLLVPDHHLRRRRDSFPPTEWIRKWVIIYVQRWFLQSLWLM